MSGVPTAVSGWLRGERRWLAEALVVALAVAVVHLLFRLSAGFLVGALNDDGVYVVLGKAIAEGQGYRSIHLVGAPVHVKYPPGLPLLLAVPWALGSDAALGAVRATVAVVNLGATAAGAGLIWWLGRQRLALPRWPLAACAIAPFVLDGTIQYYNIPLSEPYLVLGWAAALVLARPLCDPGPDRMGRAAAVGGVLAATTLCRSAAIALIPAVLFSLVLHRRWRDAAACAAGSLAPLAAWGLLRAAWIARGPLSSVPDELGYWQWLGVDGPLALAAYASRTMATNAVDYIPKLASYLFSTQWIGIAVVGVAMLGVALACVRLWRAHTALVVTTLAASAVTLLWPFAQGRLLLPLLPFLGLLAAAAIALGIRQLPPRVAAVGVPAVLGVMMVAATLRQVELREAAARAYTSGVLPPPEDLSPTLILAVRSRFISQVVQWVHTHTARDDRIMVDAPAAVYLYTGRRTVAAQPTESRLAASVFAVPGRYLTERILADSVTVVVWTPPAAGLERDILTIAAHCPQVLERVPATSAAYFRVTRDEPCLRQRVLAMSPPSRWSP